jgi:hypothetical protein
VKIWQIVANGFPDQFKINLVIAVGDAIAHGVHNLPWNVVVLSRADSIGYFKGISEQVGIPYQSLINLYLRDCAAHHRKLDLSWK